MICKAISASGKHNLCMLCSLYLAMKIQTDFNPTINSIIKLFELYNGGKHDGNFLEIDLINSVVAEKWDNKELGLQIGKKMRDMMKHIGELYDIKIVLYHITNQFTDKFADTWYMCEEKHIINKEGKKRVVIASNMLHFYVILEQFDILHYTKEDSIMYKTMVTSLEYEIEKWNYHLDDDYKTINHQKIIEERLSQIELNRLSNKY